MHTETNLNAPPQFETSEEHFVQQRLRQAQEAQQAEEGRGAVAFVTKQDALAALQLMDRLEAMRRGSGGRK